MSRKAEMLKSGNIEMGRAEKTRKFGKAEMSKSDGAEMLNRGNIEMK